MDVTCLGSISPVTLSIYKFLMFDISVRNVISAYTSDEAIAEVRAVVVTRKSRATWSYNIFSKTISRITSRGLYNLLRETS